METWSMVIGHYMEHKDVETAFGHARRFRVYSGFLLQRSRFSLSDLAVSPLMSHKRMVSGDQRRTSKGYGLTTLWRLSLSRRLCYQSAGA
ncbi:hypothetical protein AVEN_133001-1 [Araneus ventricosus]|uniref:Uncharacterized protein n=1 Tax=Araneus ventricosus TaxID=182803 RepID=A0A4Y2IKD2_ARAVE|nr:hypothetical protein AVEN_133001-1 [Araneus ventricosus]